jgi:hypothetical protein
MNGVKLQYLIFGEVIPSPFAGEGRERVSSRAFATTPMLLHEGDMAAPSTPKPARKRAARATPAKPKRPPHLAHGRWLGDLEAEAPLSEAERALVAACARGKAWAPEGWDGETRPDAPTDANTIRAILIRFLLLGGDAGHPVHEHGVMLGGAWITSALNMYQARCAVRLALIRCHLTETPDLTGATLPELVLRGCVLSGLKADRLVVTGGCFFDKGFTASGEVRLSGADIGSDLVCIGSSFINVGGTALNAHGLKVSDNLLLGDKFNATGEVGLIGAEIGGILDCDGGTFANRDGRALNAEGLLVKKGSLILRGATVEGAIVLTTARVGTLVDDTQCWQAGGHALDGLHYDRIIGPTDAASRIAWLQKQHPPLLTSEFKPQPWEQLIKVLREMGHPYDASEVAIAKQDQMRRAWVIRGGVRSVMHWLYGKLAGYGYRPIWTVYWMIGLWLFCGACFEFGRAGGFFGPTNPLIHASAALEICGGAGEGKAFWTSATCPVPPEYTTMWPWVYSLDLLLPLVNLQQDVDWAPIVINGNGEQLLGGYLLRGLLWFEILFGWAASLILVAVLGRLVEKD